MNEKTTFIEYTQPEEFYLWLMQFELDTILKINDLSCSFFTDDAVGIYGDALALDGLGMVFVVDLHFSVTEPEAETIKSLTSPGSIVRAKGCYSYIPGANGGITLHNPVISLLDPEVSLSDLNDVFVKNRWQVKS